MALHDEVRRILWEEWDPIGVRDLGGPTDEYDAYVNGVVRYLTAGRDEYALVQYLHQVETVAMGLSSSDSENKRRVARLLSSLGNRRS